MLDQNTDRMWYVIGAVIVGAAIILIMNGVFPNVFASVGDSFMNKTDETNMEVGRIITPTASDGVNLLQVSDLTPFSLSDLDVSEYAEKGIVHMATNSNLYSGIQLAMDDLLLEPNTQYILHFSYQKTGGSLRGFGGHASLPFFRPNTVYIDGVKSSYDFIDFNSAYVADDTLIHHVEVHFTMPNTVDDHDRRGVWIQPNRSFTDPVSITLFDLMLEKGHTPSSWLPYGVKPIVND